MKPLNGFTPYLSNLWSAIHMLNDDTLLNLNTKGFVKIYRVINVRLLDFITKWISSVSWIWNRFLCSALKNGDSSYYYLFLTYFLNLSYQSYLWIVFFLLFAKPISNYYPLFHVNWVAQFIFWHHCIFKTWKIILKILVSLKFFQ